MTKVVQQGKWFCEGCKKNVESAIIRDTVMLPLIIGNVITLPSVIEHECPNCGRLLKEGKL